MKATKRIAWKWITLLGAAAWTGVLAGETQMAEVAGVFERLGHPITLKGMRVTVVTGGDGVPYTAWGAIEGIEEDNHGVLGFDVETGESTFLDMSSYGRTHIIIRCLNNGNLYIYSGNPGRFFEYDIHSGALHDLGVAAMPANYWLGSAVGPDGRFYIGSYPRTHVAWVDPATNEIGTLGELRDDSRQSYVLHPEVSDDNILYAPVGLHHAELWAYDLDTGQKRQILPLEMMEIQGETCRVLVADDGEVYGELSESKFRCRADGIEMIDELPRRRRDPTLRMAGEYEVLRDVTSDGELLRRRVESGVIEKVQTDFSGIASQIFSVAEMHASWIYGGGISPANLFRYFPATGAFVDLGRQSSGGTQVYDVLAHERGLFVASYGGGHIDLYDPDNGESAHVVSLTEMDLQERPQSLASGPDGRIYIATVPVKGHLGGAIARVNPDDLSVRSWRNVIPNQSFNSVVGVPATGEMFFTSNIRGGTSAIPTETEAWVMLWDVDMEAVVWQGKPIPGASSYQGAVMAPNGVIYGLSDRGKYYAFDPVTREVLAIRDLPASNWHWPGLSGQPLDDNGYILGLAGDAVFAIDPADHSVHVLGRHEAIKGAQGYYVDPAGVLYFGSGTELWRFDTRTNVMTGNLAVYIEPPGAVSDGARWSVDGGATWGDNGQSVELDAGDYTVTFSPVHGWTEPRPITVSVQEDQLTSVSGAEGAVYGEGVVFVNGATGADSNDGLSWERAFASIQAAVNAASTGDQVWVSAGTYTSPTDPIVAIKEGVALFGGFDGHETDRDERDWGANETIIDGEGIRRGVTGAHDVILDGFTIIRGQAPNYGGGMHNGNVGFVVIRNCTFTGNKAPSRGGAIYFTNVEHPLIENCTFIENAALIGSAFLMLGGSNLTLRNSEFIHHPNYGSGVRGVIQISTSEGGEHLIESCTFAGSVTGVDIVQDAAGTRIANTLFIGNLAAGVGPLASTGSAVHNRNNTAAPLALINCTFFDNQGSDVLSTSGSGTITGINNIIRGSAGIAGNVTLTHSNVEGGFAGDGNIDANPLFVEAPAPGSDATWGTSDDTRGDLRLQPASPSIDAGDNAPFEGGGVAGDITTDRAGKSRVSNNTVDMGAYEFLADTTYAAWAVEFDFPEGMEGPEDDASGDGIVNLQKFAFGLDPLEASHQGLPVTGTETVSGKEYLTLTVTRDPRAAGIEVIIEASEDLVIWDAADVVIVEESSEVLRARTAHPLSERQRQFLRVIVRLSSP